MSDQQRDRDEQRPEGSASVAGEGLTDDQPTVNIERGEQPEARTPLPTSDPVFPTASPQLKPPAPADVSGFGAPGGASPSQVSGQPVPTAATASPAPTASGLTRHEPPTPRPPRTAAEIRADIEAGRQELSQSVEVLRDKVNEITDWRGQVRKHRRELTVAAAVVGFAVGVRLMSRRRR